MCIYVYTHTKTHAHTYVYIYIYIYICIFIYIYMYVCMCVFVCFYTYMHIWMRHVMQIIDLCFTNDHVTSQISMIPAAQMNETCHSYDQVMSHIPTRDLIFVNSSWQSSEYDMSLCMCVCVCECVRVCVCVWVLACACVCIAQIRKMGVGWWLPCRWEKIESPLGHD